MYASQTSIGLTQEPKYFALGPVLVWRDGVWSLHVSTPPEQGQAAGGWYILKLAPESQADATKLHAQIAARYGISTQG